MTSLKRWIALLAACMLLPVAALASSGNNSSSGGSSASAAMLRVPENTAMVTLYRDEDAIPDDGNATMRTGGPEAQSQMVLLWLPLPDGITAERLIDAWLWVHVPEGNAENLRVGLVNAGWTMNGSVWGDVGASIFWEAPIHCPPGLPQDAGDGWWTFDITDFTKAWLMGIYDQNGVALTVEGDGYVSIDTPFGEDTSLAPMLSYGYTSPEEALSYGRFDYTPQEKGNCLSYALRDLDPIYYDALIEDTEAFQQAYDEGGTEGALAYFWDAVQRYIGAHQEALGIAAIHPLEAFDTPIDTEKTYRVALRVGFHETTGSDGIQVDEDFDFHLRVQLSNGSWAEKTPGESSRITPGSNAAIDPGLYPWDQSFMWGYEKWADYYDSDTIYFAVEKATDAFTQHQED